MVRVHAVDEETLMAQGTASDTVREESAQPKLSDKKADTSTGSRDAVNDANEAAFQPTADVVAMVSRDVNGDPAQSRNFRVIGCSDDDPDHIKDAVWNRAGEQQGAKNYDHAKHGATVGALSDEERAARDKKEAEELRRINRGE
jgi:hypothetical protein